MRKRRPRSSRQTGQLTGLRLAIDCMPVATREAMLAGVRESDRVISGAYVDENGGVCPMLAAHRRGGRTDFLSFARSWDRFTRARGKARVATDRELAILVSQLQDSLESIDGLELDRAIAEHRELRRQSVGAAKAWAGCVPPCGCSTRGARSGPGGCARTPRPGGRRLQSVARPYEHDLRDHAGRGQLEHVAD